MMNQMLDMKKYRRRDQRDTMELNQIKSQGQIESGIDRSSHIRIFQYLVADFPIHRLIPKSSLAIAGCIRMTDTKHDSVLINRNRKCLVRIKSFPSLHIVSTSLIEYPTNLPHFSSVSPSFSFFTFLSLSVPSSPSPFSLGNHHHDGSLIFQSQTGKDHVAGPRIRIQFADNSLSHSFRPRRQAADNRALSVSVHVDRRNLILPVPVVPRPGRGPAALCTTATFAPASSRQNAHK
jgi:hypothetical protein